jgi:hypothetical protein
MKKLRTRIGLLWTVSIIMFIIIFLGVKTGFTDGTITLSYSG